MADLRIASQWSWDQLRCAGCLLSVCCSGSKEMECRPEADRHRACCPDTYGNGQRYHRCGRYRSGIHDLQFRKAERWIKWTDLCTDGTRCSQCCDSGECKMVQKHDHRSNAWFSEWKRWIRTDRKRQHQCRYDGHGTSGPCTLSGANRSKRSNWSCSFLFKRGDAWWFRIWNFRIYGSGTSGTFLPWHWSDFCRSGIWYTKL